MGNRSLILDNAKIIGALLVIFGHLYASQSDERVFLYAFHMPLFFIISGILHKFNGKIQIPKYLKKTIVPAVVYFLIFSVLYVPLFNIGVLEKELNISAGVGVHQIVEYIKNNIGAFIRGADNSNVVLWFLFALFYCKVFMDLFLTNKIYKVFLLLIIVMVLLVRKTDFYIGQACMAFPFYLLGYYSKETVLSDRFAKTLKFLLLPALVLTVLLSLWNGRVSVSGISFGAAPSVLKYLVFYLNGVIGSIFVFSIASLIKTSRVQFLAKSLLSVLGLQMIFVLIYCQYFGTDSMHFIAIIASSVIFMCCFFIDNKCYLNKLY